MARVRGWHVPLLLEDRLELIAVPVHLLMSVRVQLVKVLADLALSLFPVESLVVLHELVTV